MKSKKYMLTFCMFLSFMMTGTSSLFSQITIDNLTTLNNAQMANAMVDSLIGSGVTFSNVSFQGVRDAGGSYGYQICYFTTTGTTLTQMGIQKGIALCTGNTNLIPLAMGTNPAAANSFSKGYISSAPGEIRKSTTTINDMNLLASGGSWFNGAILEFDFVPDGDSVCFRYIFGGEEYSDNINFTNYQCTEYNDKFGFLISGPGVSGGVGYTNDARNIARLANGSEVGINAVNNGTVGSSATPNGASYCQAANPDWIQNNAVYEYNGTIQGTSPNGNTKIMIAAQGGLTPGATYHIRLLICDLRDGAYDAVVYIEAGSFSSPEPTSSIHASPSSICNGNSTYVVVNTNHGTPPYTYNWSNSVVHTTNNPSDSILVSPSANTSYTVTVTDNTVPTPLNAVSTINITVSNPVLALNTQTNVLCHGLSTGSASVTVSGGTGTYTYSWSHNAGLNNASATGLTAGNYTVTVTDGLSCPDTYSLTITEPGEALSATFPGASVTQIACYGNSTGAATVSAGGGTTSYNYNWSHNASLHTASASGLTAGTYTVTVIDANLCTVTSSVTITQPAQALTASILPASVTQVGCYGNSSGSATVTVSGGTTTYNYNWSHDASLHTANATGLNAGSYTVTVVDANLCTASSTVTITEPASPLTITTPVTNITNVACYGNSSGSATLTVSGGTGTFTYAWSHNPGLNAATASSLPANTYTVTVTDDNLCSETVSLTITQPTAALTLTPSSTSSTCGNADGSVTVTANNGTSPYEYVWLNYTDSISHNMENLAAGTYNVTVSDNNGCTSTTSVSVSDMGGPVLSLNQSAQILCHGVNVGVIEVTATGGTGQLDFLWSGGQTTGLLQNLEAGTYTLTVTDENNCVATFSHEITEPDTLIAGLTPTPVSCFGLSDGAIYLNTFGGTPGYTYEWSNTTSNQNANNLSAGWYYVTISDQNNCLFVDSIQVLQPEILASVLTSEDVACFGDANGSINLTVTGGNGNNDFAWSSGAIDEDPSNLQGGMYYVTITDSEGCVKTDSVMVNEPEQLLSTYTQLNITCSGDGDGSIDLTVTGGNGGNVYLWSNGPVTEDVSGLQPGNFSVTVTDAKGCTTSVATAITQPEVLAATVASENISCYGLGNGSMVLTASGGTGTITFAWSHNALLTSNSAENLQPGTYFATITDENACTSVYSQLITQPEELEISLMPVNLLCYADHSGLLSATQSGGTAPYDFEWSNGAITTNLNSLDAGTYNLTVTDSHGCVTSDSTTIMQPELIQVTETIVSETCPGSANGNISLSVYGGTIPYLYDWSNSAANEEISAISSGTFTVTITDANNCTVINVYDVLNESTGCLNIPTAFSPNDDGVNDTWLIEHIDLYKEISIEIYNRWGQLIFTYSGTGAGYADVDSQWDGTYQGKELEISSFIFIVDLKEGNDPIQGIVSIIK